MQSYTMQIFYSSDEKLVGQLICSVVQRKDTLGSAQIRQVEILGDGRMFFTLADGDSHLNVWHQSVIYASAEAEARQFRYSELDVYELRESAPIKSFHLKYKPCTRLQPEPAVLLTLTAYTVNIHVESLQDTEMRFLCLKSI